MTDTLIRSDEVEPGLERMQRFELEVGKLKLSGGRITFERVVGKLSGLGIVVGLIVVFSAWSGTRSATSPLDIADYQALGALGLTITIASTGLYILTSLQRYLRYWLLRLIYEQRAQTGSGAESLDQS